MNLFKIIGWGLVVLSGYYLTHYVLIVAVFLHDALTVFSGIGVTTDANLDIIYLLIHLFLLLIGIALLLAGIYILRQQKLNDYKSKNQFDDEINS